MNPLDGATAPFRPDVVMTRTLAASAVPESGFNEELRRLLRSRLILVQLLAIAYVTLIVVMSIFTPADSQVRRDNVPLLLSVPFVLSLIGTVVLQQSPGMSLRTLRLWELFHFGSHAAFNGLFRFMMLRQVAEGTPAIELAFLLAISLQGFITLILAHGVLIPNTKQRSLLVVIGLTAVPFVAHAAAGAANPALHRVSYFLMGTIQAAALLLFPAAIAVFAAARSTALQRRVFEAELRAEQIGQYTLKQKLGEGGMGEVFLAEHRLLKRPCAIKFIRPELAAHPATAARFEREVRAVTGLTHFNTVRVYDYGRADDGSFYFVMEYLDGPTLEDLVRTRGSLPPGRAVYLLRQVCGALAEAHAAGLVHRDLKPGNVIVATLGGQRDVAKLLDFGLVQDLSTETGDRLTQMGVVMGTPAYMCPEQASGSNAVDARGDIYSLGAVAFFALTGRPPFEDRTHGQLIAAHLTKLAPDIREVHADLPADLAAVLACCLAKATTDRYPTVTELDRALAACGCASEWSVESAAKWWATVPNTALKAGSQDPTRSGGGS